MTAKQIETLQIASWYVDTFQGASDSYLHGMRDGTTVPEQTVEDAEKKTNDFINEKTTDFVENGNLFSLGEALHPIMDKTSPSHEGTQSWKGLKSLSALVSGAKHLFKETFVSKSNVKIKQAIKDVRDH